MRQWLATLMLCVMLFSHGSMGAAVPHGHTHDAGHSDVASAPAMHHAGEHDDHAGAVDEESTDKAADHAVHAHVVGDLARTAAASAPASLGRELRVASAINAFGPSRGIAPLLEPPSA